MSLINKVKKIGRNDKCYCLSGKKYSKCCYMKDYNLARDLNNKEEDKYFNGHETVSEIVRFCTEYLKKIYIDHKIIDISNYLNSGTYKNFQLRNYTKKTIMVAEKNSFNQSVFENRGPVDNDIIVMYRGSFRTFQFNHMDKVLDSIDSMIKTRLAGKIDSNNISTTIK